MNDPFAKHILSAFSHLTILTHDLRKSDKNAAILWDNQRVIGLWETHKQIWVCLGKVRFKKGNKNGYKEK